MLLPFDMDFCIKSECWSFYKTGIIAAQDYGKDWIASNFDLYLYLKDVFFGDGLNSYKMPFFSEVLSFEDINIYSIQPQNINNFIIQSINKGRYIVTDVNHNRLFTDEKEFLLHDNIINGYDIDKKIFYSPIFKGRYESISFENMEKSFSDVRKYYLSRRQDAFLRGYGYDYPLTCIQPKKINYNNSELFMMIYHHFLMNYYYITDRTISFYNCSKYNSIRHTNNECLKFYYKYICSLIDENRLEDLDSNSFRRSLLKFSEHRSFIYYLLERLGDIIGSDDIIRKSREEYLELKNEMGICYLLGMKYCEKKDKKIIYDILTRLSNNANRHDSLLHDICTELNKIYVDGYFKGVQLC